MSESLQGGRAGVLPPESRTRILDLGRRLGLRPFDTNLIIAIVQDHARCGTEPRSEMISRLAMVPGLAQQIERRADAPPQTRWFAWIGAACVLSAVLIGAGAMWLGV